MNGDLPKDSHEQTFVVFVADQVSLAIPSAAVLRILTSRDAATPPSVRDQAARVLVLRTSDADETVLLPLAGVLRMVTIPTAHVAELPSLCRGENGASVAVAIDEDRILFLIIDPIVYLRTQRSLVGTLSPMEPA